MRLRGSGISCGIMVASTLALVACQAPAPGTVQAPTATVGTSPVQDAPTAGSNASPSASPAPTTQPAPASYRVYTMAGNGIRGDSDEGAVATQTSLFSPTGVLQASDGGFYVADYKINKIRHVDPAGILTTVAGSNLMPGDSGEGGPATQAELAKPYGMVFDPQGHLVFSEYGYSVPGTNIPGKVRWIDSAGLLHRLAGGGNLTVADGVAATDADLQGPEGLVYDAGGDLYIAEYNGHRVVKMDTTGHLTIVAGTGDAGNDGDGGPARSAHLNSPNWLTFDPQGQLVIVDSANQNVRRVKADGTIETLAGIGAPTNDPAIAGYVANQATVALGDGGQATQASLHTPTTAVFDAFGRLLITDSENYLVRRIDTHGVITSVAGTGLTPDASSSALPDGIDARHMAIGLPDGMTLGAGGRIFFSEYSGYKVRELSQ